MNYDEKQKLWDEYRIKRTPELREKIILEYSGLVKIVAGKLSMYLGYNVELNDLVGYGIFGLIDAIDKFNFEKGVKFETYASLRIRGSILDQIRKMDWVPRTVRQKQRKLDETYRKLELKYGRIATDEEIASELDITTDELDNWQSQANVSNLISLEDYMEQSDTAGEAQVSEDFAQPEKLYEKAELKRLLVEALQQLTEKERKVITLYYYEELTLKEISLVLEVSESRVSQLHSKALQKMRTKLGCNIEVFWG